MRNEDLSPIHHETLQGNSPSNEERKKHEDGSSVGGGFDDAGVKRFFNGYAYDFDALYGKQRSLLNSFVNPLLRKSMKLRYKKTMDYCQPIKGITVLDVGCGPGHYSISLAKQGAAKVVGIDFSEEMIQLANRKAEQEKVTDICSFFPVDVFQFRTDMIFDYSVLMGFMDYIREPIPLLEKVIGLTRDKVFISFPKDSGILAVQRRMKYRKRCDLYLYGRDALNRLFTHFSPYPFEIESISRDYFVSLSIRPKRVKE